MIFLYQEQGYHPRQPADPARCLPKGDMAEDGNQGVPASQNIPFPVHDLKAFLILGNPQAEAVNEITGHSLFISSRIRLFYGQPNT